MSEQTFDACIKANTPYITYTEISRDEFEETKQELISRIQGTSEDSNSIKDSFKFIGEYNNFEDFIKKLDTMCNLENLEKSLIHNGYFRALVNNKIVNIINEIQNYEKNIWSQKITCAGINLTNDVKKTETEYLDYDNNGIYKYTQRMYIQKFVNSVDDNNNFNIKNGVKSFCRRHYLYKNNINNWTQWYDLDNHYVQSQNYCKKIAIFGDTFAKNMSSDSDDYKFNYNGELYNFVDYFAEKLGATCIDNYAVNNQGVRSDEQSPFIVNLMNQLKTAQSKNIYDIYIIMGGIADYLSDEVPLGDSTGYVSNGFDNEDQYISYCDGLSKSIDYIKTNAPNAKIYTITPFKTYNSDWGWNPKTKIRNKYNNTFYEFIQAQKEVAQIKGVPCLNIWAMQEFSNINISEYYISNLYPNGKGYYKVLDKIVEFISYGIGNEVVDVNALINPIIEKIKISVNNEIQRATQAEQANTAAIANETQRAKNAETNINNKITEEIKNVKQLNQTSIAEETQRAKDAEQANADAINAEKERAKQAEQANRQLITDLVGKSPETLDTIYEISSWILNDKTGAAAMAKEINENRNAINIEKERAKDAEKNNADSISNNLNVLIEHDKIVRPVIVYLNGKQGLLSLGLAEVGTLKEINFIISAKKGVETITNIIITVNGNRIDSDTYIENVTTTKEYNVNVRYTYNINNKEVTEEAQSKAYVTFVKAMYFGFNELESINNDIINSFEKQQLNTTPVGTYKIVSSINGYMWLCVPDNMNINKVTIGGFDVPIELNNTSEVDGYKCYRSSNELVAGTYNILIS